MRFDAKIVILVCVSALSVGCGGTLGARSTVSATQAARRATFDGSILYEARSPTFSGASLAIERRPARLVGVRALDDARQVVFETSTDRAGHFHIEAPRAVAFVEFAAHIDADGYRISVTQDADGRRPHAISIPVPVAGDLNAVALDDAPDGPGGAFHMLDTLLVGEEATRHWLGARLPELFAYWGRGVTTNWSFFEGEVPAGSGRYKLELLGGERDRRSTTDTDEHDEAVVLHELGHFVFDRLTTASSSGGMHPSGHFVDPGLAWEEGRATWFAALVLGRPIYTDTVGLEPRGSLQAHTDLERRNAPPRGLGSQESVEEVLWDLVDGSAALPEDLDHDGTAIEPVALLRAMVELGHDPASYPCFPTFLRFIVDRGLATEAAVRGVLVHGSLPESLLPSDGVSPWPLELPLEREVSGRIDSVSPRAPSGGPRMPHTGFDAIHTYRIAVPTAGTLSLRLIIDGSGTESDRSDLDLELRDLRADEIASSRGTSVEEEFSRRVEAGFFIVRVVDGGRDGAAARYRLSARLTQP